VPNGWKGIAADAEIVVTASSCELRERDAASTGIPPTHRPRAPVTVASWLASLGELQGRPYLVPGSVLSQP
jgi:hypothetical protein